MYNEPLRARRGDIVPKLGRVVGKQIHATVRARLDVERKLRLCGLAKSVPSIPPTVKVRAILTRMLSETDSPLAASLRARAAELAGPLGAKKAAPALRRIAVDEAEDLATRLGAVRSYFHLGGAGVAATFDKVLASKTWQVRACAYVAVMNGESRSLRAVAEKRFKTERTKMVTAYVSRFVTSALAASATVSDTD